MIATKPAPNEASSASTAPKLKPKANPNALLLFFRKYHTWFGVFAAGFVVMIALTGIYLNHKDTFRFLFEGGTKEQEHLGPNGKPGLPNVQELASLPISMLQAIDLAVPHLGGQPIERVELRTEHGRLLYKVKAIEGPEALIDARTGAVELKLGEKGRKQDSMQGEMSEKPAKPKKERSSASDTTIAGAVSPPTDKGMDWGKAIKDLHTGKIGGDAGKLLIDFVAGILIVLTFTGLYLWIVPVLRKRRSARERAAAVLSAAR